MMGICDLQKNFILNYDILIQKNRYLQNTDTKQSAMISLKRDKAFICRDMF